MSRGRDKLSLAAPPASTPPAAGVTVKKYFRQEDGSASPVVPGDTIPGEFLNSWLEAIDYAVTEGAKHDSTLDLDIIAKSNNPNTWLWQIYRAAATSVAVSPVNEFKLLSDTPAAAEFTKTANVGKVFALGAQGKVVLNDAASVARKKTAAPTTSDDNSDGDFWHYEGTDFVYRGVQGTGGVDDGASATGSHIWDVIGTHAVCDVNADGSFISNGIHAPSGYAGDGWGRFTGATNLTRGVTRLTFRDITNANYFVSAIDVDITANPAANNNNLDNRENFGVIEKQNGMVSIKGGHEAGSNHISSSRMMVRITRTG